MKLLIAYGTTEGQTRKICEFLQDEAEKAGHRVTMTDTTGPDIDPGGFDAAIIAASVHMGSYQSSVEHFVKEHCDALNRISGAFVSVSLTAATDEPESWKELEELTTGFLDQAGWNPTYTEQVAGALRYTKYNFFKKFIMRMISEKEGRETDTSRDYEYTDWDQVRRIIKRLEKSVGEGEKMETRH